MGDVDRLRLSELPATRLDARAQADARALASLAVSAARLLAFLDRHAEIWARPADRPLSADERALTLDTFLRVVDHHAALGGLARTHLDFWELAEIADPMRCARHFVLGFGAYLQELSLGLRFVELTQGRPQFEILLDEGSERHGIPAGAFERLKESVVAIQHVPRVFAARQYHNHVASPHLDDLRAGDPVIAGIIDSLEQGYQATKARLGLDSARLVVENVLDLLRDGTQRAIFPVQAHVCAWLGDTRVRGRSALISSQQIAEAIGQCRPGDVVLERRNWYLSNIGLPGFWPHAALWLGSPGELAEWLDDDPAVREAYRGPFTRRLERRFASSWAAYLARDEEGHQRRLIEAVSEGVVFSTAEHSLAADYAAALRPRLARLEIARAIERAFEFAGLPYDFDFDCYSDQSLVCSELVYKAYEPRAGARGIALELTRMAGRMTLPPNDMVAQMDRAWDTPTQQLDLVWFLDGRERTGAAAWGDAATFRASHRRPKWDISQD